MGLYWMNVRDPLNVLRDGIPFYVKKDQCGLNIV